MPDGETKELLKIALSAAVPMWITELKTLPWEEISRISNEASQYIAEHGDALMYKTKGVTAKAFNHLAKGIAALSFVPGGVTLFGLHFESRHEGGESATGAHTPRNITFAKGTLGRFILKHGLRIEWEQVGMNPGMRDDPWAATANHFSVRLIDKGDRSLIVGYSTGSAFNEPDVEMVLHSLTLDAWAFEGTKGSVKEYADLFGLDPQHPGIAESLESLATQTAGLRVFLGKEGYKELLGLAESGKLGASRRG